MLFKKAKNEACFLKVGIRGFEGSGKSFTAGKMAVGLYRYAKLKKPVAYLDTEKGSDFLIPKFKKCKVPLDVSKTRAFMDLVDAVREAEKHHSILIIDSITHFWNELMDSYLKKHNLKRIKLHHWMTLKKEWRVFSDLFVNSNVHIIMCGRAGWDFGYEENEEGEKELQKTGTKMKVESETGFEPDLLLEMEKVKKTSNIGSEIIQRCWVLKDRSDTIQGKKFDRPDFKDFLPHVECLNLGGKHKAIDTSRSSESMHKQDFSKENMYKQKTIILELMHDALDKDYSTRTDEDKRKRIFLLEMSFGTSSKTEIENMSLKDLQVGYDKLKKKLEKKSKGGKKK